MYKRTFICPDNLDHPKDITFDDHRDFEEKTDLDLSQTKCLCCGESTHTALLQISSPFVRTRSNGSSSGAGWVGKDFEEIRTRMEFGEEPARPIVGIVSMETRERMVASGIDAGKVLAYKNRHGQVFIEPNL